LRLVEFCSKCGESIEISERSSFPWIAAGALEIE